METKERIDPDRVAERRTQRRWVPVTAGWLAGLIGLTDVVGAIVPEWHRHMLRVTGIFPGALSSAARTATVITGLMLLLLSHALRRRKHRAWQAVVVLLAVSLLPPVLQKPGTRAGAVACLVPAPACPLSPRV